MSLVNSCSSIFFFNDTATTEIYTLSLHDALPISTRTSPVGPSPATASSSASAREARPKCTAPNIRSTGPVRSEEHTSELQSRLHLVCRLLLEKKKHKTTDDYRLILKCTIDVDCRT